MKQEKLIENFQVEELEQRFEMGWKVKEVDVEYHGNHSQV